MKIHRKITFYVEEVAEEVFEEKKAGDGVKFQKAENKYYTKT